MAKINPNLSVSLHADAQKDPYTILTANHAVISSSSIEENKSTLSLTEDAIIKIGDDFEVDAKTLKLMLKNLLELTKEENPEEFI